MEEELVTRVTKLEGRVDALEKALGADTSGVGKKRKVSVNEFLRSKGPKTAVDTVLTLAVYFERYEGDSSFNTSDLMALIRKAKQAKPSNINDLVNRNISKGYLEEEGVGEDGKKRWYVTTSGEDLINNAFNRNA